MATATHPTLGDDLSAQKRSHVVWTQNKTWDPRIIVALLSLVGLGIRLIIVRGFWLDEATSGYDSRLSYSAMLHQLSHDNHPPLEYSILWVVAHTVGSTQTDLRIPSIVFGTLMIPMLYLAGRALYRDSVGVLAAAFGSVGALAVWYAQEARMYALFMLLATISIWAQSRALATNRNRFWVAWTLASIAMLWNQWFSALAVSAEVVFFIWVIVADRGVRPCKDRLVKLGGSVAAALVSLAPILPLLYTQFRNNQANGLGFSSSGSAGTGAALSPYGIFNNLVWATIGYHSNWVIAAAVAIWPLGILAILLTLGRSRLTRRANRQLLATALLPMAAVFAASAVASSARSLFEVRYFIELVPALYLLLAGAAWNLTRSVGSRVVVSGGILAVLVIGLVLQQTDSGNPRLYGYDAAFRQISSVARPGAVILYAPAYLNVDVDYFEPKIPSAPVSTSAARIPDSSQIFIVGSFDFVGASPAATDSLVAQLKRTRHLNATFQAPNVFVWEFS